MKRATAKRLTQRHWVEAAAAALAESGPDALTIEAMCARLKKTKGSFYSHYADYDAFLAALISFWREASTHALIAAVEERDPPDARLALLNRLAMRVDFKLDQGMRRLGDRYPAVAAAVAENDATRVAFLTKLHKEGGVSASRRAQDLATIEYAAFVGLQQIMPDASPAALARLYTVFSGLGPR